jgi:hypothetical protein
MTPIVKIETRSRVRENLCRDAAITPDLLEAGSVRAEMTANDDFGGPTKSSPSLSEEGRRCVCVFITAGGTREEPGTLTQGASVFPGSSRLGIEPKTPGWLVQEEKMATPLVG